MKKGGRYDTSGLIEDQYEPGSGGRVLRNLLGINAKREMDQAETEALKRAEGAFFRTYSRTHRFTSSDICRMHKVWLGEIYAWAGSYRQVKIGKGAFSFAFPAQIPKLMSGLDEDSLRRHTPCGSGSKERIVQALSEVHVELLLIHPFREGNGRLARVLATLMALQAGLPPPDFRSIKGKRKQEYFSAVRAGMDRNYTPMAEVFSEVLRKNLGA